MRQFYKLALLLSFASVDCLQISAMQAAVQMPDDEGDDVINVNDAIRNLHMIRAHDRIFRPETLNELSPKQTRKLLLSLTSDTQLTVNEKSSYLAQILQSPVGNAEQIGSAVVRIISPTMLFRDAQDFVTLIASNLDSGLNKILSLTSLEQDNLLDSYEQALDAQMSPNDRLEFWLKLTVRVQGRTIFDLPKVITRRIEEYEEVTDSDDESATALIFGELRKMTDDLYSFSKHNQCHIVELLSQALAKNRSVEKTGDEYKIWFGLCRHRILPQARLSLIDKAIQSLEDLVDRQYPLAKETEGEISEFHASLCVGAERQKLIDALEDDQRFKAVPDLHKIGLLKKWLD